MNRFASRLEKVSNISEIKETQKSQKEKTSGVKITSKKRITKSVNDKRIPSVPKTERKEVRSYSLSPSTIKDIETTAKRLGYRSSSLLVQTILDSYLTEEKE